jgi:hypothetical protein
MGEQQRAEEAWREVGGQFQTLGDSLAAALRAAWGEGEENRELVEDVRDGLEALIDRVGQAIRVPTTSPEGGQLRVEAEKTAESLRVVGEQTWDEALLNCCPP